MSIPTCRNEPHKTSQQEIADAVGIPQKTVDDHIKLLARLETLPKSLKLSASYQEKRRAELRQKATQLQGRDDAGQPLFGEGNITLTEMKGQTRDIVAEKIGMGGSTSNPLDHFVLTIWLINSKQPFVCMPELLRKKCYRDNRLDKEDLKDIAEAKEDIHAGRVYSTEQVKKSLGH